MVHRDIKPANIHLGRLGLEQDFVKVLDFGLVKHSAAGAEQSLATGADATPGTPAYMAPEMALGESVDGRADLYALGCVGYFLLTRQVVFEAATALQAVAKHVSDKPVPPSQRGGGVDIPPELERLIMKLLAKNPDDRVATAGELAELLAAIPVEPWTQQQAAVWWGDIGSD
jgi:serine/threonine-protein kinase